MNDEYYMKLAIEQARKAKAAGDLPSYSGCVSGFGKYPNLFQSFSRLFCLQLR
jgi:hypothetical protein